MKKNRQAYFFSMKIKMMDLWMQIEGTTQTFIMNFNVLDFSNLPPECLKLHRFQSAFTPQDPLEISFFSLPIQASERNTVKQKQKRCKVRLFKWQVKQFNMAIKHVVVCWLLNIPATCKCISGTDLRRLLPHWGRSCRSNSPPLSSHSILTPEPTTPSADPIMPGAWQGSHWNANF